MDLDWLTKMKKMHSIKSDCLKIVSAFVALGLFFSCSDNDMFQADTEGIYSGKYNAIVTVKTDSEGRSFFQLDESTTIEPVSWENSYRTEVRALLNFSKLSEPSTFCTMKARVKEIESVLTLPAERITYRETDFKSANDPVIVYPDWLTNCEDGYITLHLAIQGDAAMVDHKFSLGIDQGKPTELYLKHEKGSDTGTQWKECMVAFRVRDLIPDAGDEKVTLNLHFLSYDGGVTMSFSYSSSAGKESVTVE